MAVKSLTGSRKLNEVLNRYGHCVSYHTVEELETELTFKACEEDLLAPHGMSLSSNLGTGVAFDNYDRFVETLSGKDTLHDTVGIAYQIIEPAITNYEETDFETECHGDQRGPQQQIPTNRKEMHRRTNSCPSGLRRRRAYEPTGLDIEPYHKKPKMKRSMLLPINDAKRLQTSGTHLEAANKDLLWMFSLYFSVSNTPMWVGWNAMLSPAVSDLQQNIWYLPQINESPTSISVVVETLKRAKIIAEECGKQNIAKIDLQIQAEESPTYDKIFVHLGAFHIEMAFFCAIGKYIAESGGPYILNECHIIERGSLKGFITGKNYNRCKRIHQLFAAAMEILHFKSFLEKHGDETISDEIKHELDVIRKEKDLNNHVISKEVMDILEAYTTYAKETGSGKHGLTAQYWMGYINMIHCTMIFLEVFVLVI